MKTRQQERFYGRRSGRPLNAARQVALAEILPQVEIALPAEAAQQIDLAALFGAEQQDYWLEIGFGNGEMLLQQAQQHPQIGMIGAEPYLNGVSALCRTIADSPAVLRNIRLWPEDVRPLLEALPDHALGRIYLLFPDPWPKRRHRQRRFIVPENLDRLARILRPGGKLYLATDHPELALWMFSHCRRHPAFANITQNWHLRPADQPRTRYEQKRLEGAPVYLCFQRKKTGETAKRL